MRRVTIVQGEHYVAWEPGVVIATLLGSCISVCLHDAAARVGGMNHFLLGEPAKGRAEEVGGMQIYGVHAMETLINAMMHRGAKRSRLRAHIYGGANIVRGLGSIGRDNAEFARKFMATEGITIARCDVGGLRPRKVEFLPYEGRVRAQCVAEAPPVTVTRAPVFASAGDVELF